MPQDAKPDTPIRSWQLVREWMGLCSARLVAVGLNVILFVIVARRLDAFGLADFLWLLAAWSWLAIAAGSSWTTLALRAIARKECDPRDAIADASHRCGRWAFVAAIAFAGVVVARSHADTELIVGLVCAATMLALPWQVAAAAELARGQSKTLGRAEVVGRSCAVGLAALIVVDAASALLAHCLGIAVANAWLMRSIARAAGPAAGANSPIAWHRIVLPNPFGRRREDVVGRAAALRAGDLARAAYGVASPVVAAGLVAGSHLAFSAPQRLLALVCIVPASLTTVLMGPMAQRAARTHSPLPRRTAAPARAAPMLAAVIGLIVAIAFALIAAPVLGWLEPSTRDDATTLHCTWILAAALPAIAIGSVALPRLIAERREARALLVSLAGLASFATGALLGSVWLAATDSSRLLTVAASLCACEWVVACGAWIALRSSPSAQQAHAPQLEALRPVAAIDRKSDNELEAAS